MKYVHMEQEIKRETLDYAPALLQAAWLPRRVEASAADGSWCCRSHRLSRAPERLSAGII